MTSAHYIQTYAEAADIGDPSALTHVYDPATNIAIWQRELTDELRIFADQVSSENVGYESRFSGSMKEVVGLLKPDLPEFIHRRHFLNDVELLVEMFCELLGVRNVGLRLAVLTQAMCPKFHVDRVPCRLITTYVGSGTEWVGNTSARRDSRGRVDVLPDAEVNCLQGGEVALMKGETWEDNEGRGLVHRSPAATVSSPRLVLTLDCL